MSSLLNRAFAILLILPLSMSVLSAQVITLQEEVPGKKKPITISPEGRAIVDVNSTIQIKLDRAEITRELAQFQGLSRTDTRLQELTQLNTLLRAEADILKFVNDTLRAGNQRPTLATYQRLGSLSVELLDKIELDSALYADLIDINTEIAWLEFSEQENATYVEFVLQWLEDRAGALREQIRLELGVGESLDSSLTAYFRLGAFIKDKQGGRPVPIENFSTAEQNTDPQLISTVGAALSEKEKDAISETLSINQEMKVSVGESFRNMKQLIGQKARNLFASREAYDSLNTRFTGTLSTIQADTTKAPATEVLKSNQVRLSQVLKLYGLVSENFSELASSFSAANFQGKGLDKLLNQVEEVIVSSFQVFKSDVDQFAGSQPEEAGLKELRLVEEEYETYQNQAREDVAGIRKFMASIRRFLNPFRKAYLENEDFGEDVKRFTVGSRLPPFGYIDLKYLYGRKAGDEILIKAVIERGVDRDDPNFEEMELYRRQVEIAKVAPHIKMSGSVLLANPYDRADNAMVKLENTYQFAPAYGIILKTGSRKSKFYNDFISLGLGLVFSSPDFNLDGTPEFGAGLTITAFRDIFSVGWSWNFGLDEPYAFLGFNIPFSVGGLPTQNSAGDPIR
ncbi:MAG: hypothetical protein AAFR61_20550 [Bacteroidota bacterium]